MFTRVLMLIAAAGVVHAQTAPPATSPVTFERILRADREPQNWLTYSGSTLSQRYSTLTQINPGQRQGPHDAVGLPGALDREVRIDAAGGRRHDVPDAGAQRRGRARRRHRRDQVAVFVFAIRATRGPAADG